MRYGMLLDVSQSVDQVVDHARGLEEAGIDSVWVSQIFGYDALTLLSVIGREVPGLELGTAVVPIYPRHPVALAIQALTVQAAVGGRLTLGIGLSHQVVIDGMYGYSYKKPALHMREYLGVLTPLLAHDTVAFEGDTVKASTMAPLEIEASPPPVLIAALAPIMLGIAGTMADGTVTWMTGPATIERHIVPSITAAAESAGRPRPRVAVGLPVCVTSDPEAARERAGRAFSLYGHLPSYRAMLDREGASGPGEVAVVGSEEDIEAVAVRLGNAGATDFVGAAFGSPEERRNTASLLAELAKAKERERP